ncbi:hypothetical protein BAU18_000106 [Enterococcus diestrammenae]|uniref:Uncharacterized protein n=1 Tax=Enterococcus diestrammenae TaxID=1155073 RepID=A0ABV0F0I9_9ENTE
MAYQRINFILNKIDNPSGRRKPNGEKEISNEGNI